jgi:hypothetical protein
VNQLVEKFRDEVAVMALDLSPYTLIYPTSKLTTLLPMQPHSDPAGIEVMG